jgi:hypothetical protein
MPVPADHAARRRDDRLARARRLTLWVAGGAAAASLGLGTAFAQALPGHRAAAAATQPGGTRPATTQPPRTQPTTSQPTSAPASPLQQPAQPPAIMTAGPSPLWYATRASGVMALVLLTATVVLGVAGTARFATPRWPRVITARLHRSLSLLAVAFVAAH